MISVSTVTVLSRDWRVSTSTYLITVMKVRISWACQLISRCENVKRMMVSLLTTEVQMIVSNNRQRRTTRVTSVNEESYSVQTNVSSDCIMSYIRVFIITTITSRQSRFEISTQCHVHPEKIIFLLIMSTIFWMNLTTRRFAVNYY